MQEMLIMFKGSSNHIIKMSKKKDKMKKKSKTKNNH